MTQNREGLPASIVEDRRFFPLLGSGKTDTPRGWNTPENWKYLDDIPEDKNFGFAIGGQDSTYLLIDYDHCIENKVLDPRAKEVYQRITAAAGETYIESSLSGTGMHMIIDLGDYSDNFDPIGNSAQEIIVWMDAAEYSNLPEDQRDAVPKIELFYKQAGRYVYLTGKNRRTIPVARDEAAAAMLRELLTIRDENHRKYNKTKQAPEQAVKAPVDADTLREVQEALQYVSAADYEVWIRCGLACHNIGLPFEVWDHWSAYADMRTGEKYANYDPEETARKWKSFEISKSRWNEGTIFRYAIAGGYKNRIDRDYATWKENAAELQEEQPAAGALAEVFGADAVVDVIADQAETVPEPDWIIEGLCTAGECAIVSGASKSGKSYLMTGLCIAAASGGVWLNKFSCKRSPVLYIQGENGRDDARARFHKVFEAMAIDPAACEPITMVCADGIVKPLQELREVLISEIRQHDYRIVVLDPLYCFYKGSEIDEQDAKAFVSNIKTICRDTGAVLVVVHHHSKGAAIYRNASSRASGSGMLQRAFSTLLDLSEITGDDAAKLPAGERGFELSGQPRQAAGFVHNIIFDYPLWRSDTAGILPKNARNRGQTAAARANNPKLRKAAEIRELMPKMMERAFENSAKVDDAGAEYVTTGNVVQEFLDLGMDVSERTIERRLDDGLQGFRREQTPGRRSWIRQQEFDPNVSDRVLPGNR